MIRLFAVSILLGLTALPVHAFRLCVPEQDFYPLMVLQGRDGTAVRLTNMVFDQLDMSLEVVHRPITRCLQELQHNLVDGFLASPFTPERSQMGVFPLKDQDGLPDERLATLEWTYALYRRKGDTVGWENRRFTGLNGPLGISSGAAITLTMRQQGVEVDDGASTVILNLEKLAAGRVQASLLPRSVADYLLLHTPKLQATIEQAHPEVATGKLYLLLAKDWFQRNPILAQQLWAAFPKVRRSKAYQRSEADFLRRYP
ncbi:hypothetical protein [Leeia aquatica]|uniref:Solute-binding protein family 3/N-terminal domain-containing protein n=1 Tax=Leeia aquatica TaxID=2725557 RepID=A0A847S5A8_9NEIS|nr:hypothetical protein [Leeia aquatica]NLR76941.1 hypothetical protein [Leeia aquatica]